MCSTHSKARYAYPAGPLLEQPSLCPVVPHMRPPKLQRRVWLPGAPAGSGRTTRVGSSKSFIKPQALSVKRQGLCRLEVLCRPSCNVPCQSGSCPESPFSFPFRFSPSPLVIIFFPFLFFFFSFPFFFPSSSLTSEKTTSIRLAAAVKFLQGTTLFLRPFPFSLLFRYFPLSIPRFMSVSHSCCLVFPLVSLQVQTGSKSTAYRTKLPSLDSLVRAWSGICLQHLRRTEPPPPAFSHL